MFIQPSGIDDSNNGIDDLCDFSVGGVNSAADTTKEINSEHESNTSTSNSVNTSLRSEVQENSSNISPNKHAKSKKSYTHFYTKKDHHNSFLTAIILTVVSVIAVMLCIVMRLFEKH